MLNLLFDASILHHPGGLHKAWDSLLSEVIFAFGGFVSGLSGREVLDFSPAFSTARKDAQAFSGGSASLCPQTERAAMMFRALAVHHAMQTVVRGEFLSSRVAFRAIYLERLQIEYGAPNRFKIRVVVLTHEPVIAL